MPNNFQPPVFIGRKKYSTFFEVSLVEGLGNLPDIESSLRNRLRHPYAHVYARARYGRVWDEKEEEFLTFYIEGSFRPLFSGVCEFNPSKFVKIRQGFPVICQDFSKAIRAFGALFRVDDP